MMQIQFSGSSANQFYKFIKQKYIPSEKLTKFGIVLSCFNLIYERTNKSSDKIATKKFINFSYTQFQKYIFIKISFLNETKKACY